MTPRPVRRARRAAALAVGATGCGSTECGSPGDGGERAHLAGMPPPVGLLPAPSRPSRSTSGNSSSRSTRRRFARGCTPRTQAEFEIRALAATVRFGGAVATPTIAVIVPRRPPEVGVRVR